MALEQTMFVGDTPEILVDVIVDGQHVAATIDGTTTRVEGNAATPTVTTIGTGNYRISFPGLTPAPAEGDTLYIKVNGSVDSTSTAWTEAVYKLKVLPQIVTSMDTKIDTIDSVVEDIEVLAEEIVETVEVEVAQGIFNLPSETEIADAVLAAGDVDGYTLEETLKICMAALGGKLAGAGTATITFTAVDDSKSRITATVDGNGNRTAVTLDTTG